MRRITCPTGCGSTEFRAARLGVIVQDFEINALGEIEPKPPLAEAGGQLQLACTNCGHAWKSRRDLNLARFIEESWW